MYLKPRLPLPILQQEELDHGAATPSVRPRPRARLLLLSGGDPVSQKACLMSFHQLRKRVLVVARPHARHTTSTPPFAS